ncbi:glycogen debranching protein GlgX [Kineosporiaceae bacterium SCSIO 59966]|nr:glycogen debranching protein GlgX [Kineosporiaceae bacterium SCSIO 59966]
MHLRDGGAHVAVHAPHADAVEVALLDGGPGGGLTERRLPLRRRTHGVWHDVLPGVAEGQRYGLRVHGPWDPAAGHRFNPAKLVLDPYTRAVTGRVRWGPEVFGQQVDPVTWAPRPGDVRDERDSAGHVPHGVVVRAPVADPAERPRVPWADTVVYEAHVRGLTMRHPDVPEELRGSYAALAHPAVVGHLLDLGVTTLELLPVHAIADEPALVRRGLRNYWGYNTLAFFAPEPRYASAAARAAGPQAVLDELHDAVRALHAAGLEVLLDVVYNHTAEGGPHGPVLSLKGVDHAAHYLLDGSGGAVDVTGCGNTLDFTSARVVQLALDSLRYWVQAFGVDGFRFDLATTLARGRNGFDPDHPFLVAARADPVLADVKLVAEPWDVGPHGWRTGQFPPPFAEWNDRFRDGVRTFWLADPARLERGHGPGHGVRELATRVAGSADLFTAGDRGPHASVNYVTAHDGFTLADLTAYEHKHNEANGEGNRDGHPDNRSWNHGTEGWAPPGPDGDVIEEVRRRSARNLLGTLLLSAGVPMLTAGDEIGRTQLGNNNAYCLDDATTWLDWAAVPGSWREDLLATVRELLRLRREHAVLRRDTFWAGRPVHPDGTRDLAWFGPDAAPIDHARWHDPGLRTLQAYLDGEGPGTSLLLVLHGDLDDGPVLLPGPPWARAWQLLWDSAWRSPRDAGQDGETQAGGTSVPVTALSMRLYGAAG